MSKTSRSSAGVDRVALRRRVLRSAIVVIAGLLLFYSKLTFDLTPWAQAVTSAATTMKYGIEGHVQTRVLLFTEQDLGTVAQNRFPIPYEIHAAVIANLDDDDRRPRALFIDFAFVQPDRRDAMWFGKLRDAVCNLHKHIPVFVVDTRPVSDDPKAPRESPFGDCAEAVGAVIDDEEPGGGLMTYPACGMPPRHEHDDEHAGLAVRLRRLLLGDDAPCTGPYSAAYALWNVRSPRASADAPDSVARDEKVALVWPARSEPQTMGLCDTQSGVAALKDAVFEVYAEGAEAFKRRCPYTDTITAGQLLSSDHDTVERAGRLLRNATVLYGGKISLAGDVLKSPVYKDLAGVYYHAMAFDNLVTFDGHPKRETPVWLKHLIALALVVVAVRRAVRSHHGEREAPTPGESMRRYVAVLQVVLAFVAIAIVGVVYGALKARIPEYLLLGCFALYLCVRFVTNREAALTSLACFTFALVMFWWFAVSVEIFFSMILFLEVVHLMLHHLTDAARKVRPIAESHVPLRLSERAVLALLDPFMPD